MIAPVTAVADAIRVRTEEFLKKLGTAVSAKPIVMRAEYAFCPNLTIIDTPGFVLKVSSNIHFACFQRVICLIYTCYSSFSSEPVPLCTD